MRKTLIAILISAVGVFTFNCSPKAGPGNSEHQNVYLEFDSTMPQAIYGAGKLKEALTANGYSTGNELSKDGYRVTIAIDTLNLADEAYSLLTEGKTIK
jgi:hypothetical protein